MEVVVAPDPGALSAAVADAIADGIVAATEASGRAVVAFSGGATPEPMLRLLAQRDLPWDTVTVFQVDERVAPDGHEDRNAVMLQRALTDHVPAISYLMPVTAGDLEGAAAAYAALLRDVCAGVLDVVHLGLGPDGHTASLVPDDPVLDVEDADVAVTGEYHGRRRMTLTYPALGRARRIVWEIAGADKAEALATMMANGDVPAAGVRKDIATVCADAAAARLLGDRA
jgi:6-phosphogluconolactonase